MFHLYRQLYNIHKSRERLEGVEKRIDTSNYGLHRPLLKGKNKKSCGINERLIRWKNDERICGIKGTVMQS